MKPVTVVVTVRNETRNIRALMESLVPQVGVAQVIVVDAMSTDNTAAIVQEFKSRIPGLVVVRQACGRGEGRNIGAALATADLIAFTDGDCLVHPHWAQELATAWDGASNRVVAGTTLLTGSSSFARLDRVELPHLGQDTTWPSCNLAYPRLLFERIGGFDPSFVTAEDIDLNFRAVRAGARIVQAPQAIVYARTRESAREFLRQAYWNGYGRKQLTRKHGSLWKDYRLGRMAHLQGGLWGFARLGAGFFGYLSAKVGRPPPRKVDAPNSA